MKTCHENKIPIEGEIMSDQEIKVSVCCLAYNHEKYIHDALEGFVNQQTSFRYEVIIHDDASADGTASIIQEYAEKYPDIIIPILQTENQYTKHLPGGIIYNYLYPIARGKYIALCEGDDYWTDVNKIQKQVSYMESHPECSFCFTNACVFDCRTHEKKTLIPFTEQARTLFESKKDYNVGELAKLGFLPTASFFFPRAQYKQLPNCYFDYAAAGDIKMKLYFTSMGYAHLIDQETCVYRMNVTGSAMTSWGTYNKKRRRSIYDSLLHVYENIDEYTHGKYHDDFEIAKREVYINRMMCAESKNILDNPIYSNIYSTLNLKKKVRFWIELLIPEKAVMKIKSTIKNISKLKSIAENRKKKH